MENSCYLDSARGFCKMWKNIYERFINIIILQNNYTSTVVYLRRFPHLRHTVLLDIIKIFEWPIMEPCTRHRTEINSKHTKCYCYPITLGNYHATAIFCNTKTQLPSNDSTPHYQQNILVLYYHKIETLAGCYGYEMGWGNSLDQRSLFQAVAAGWKYLVQDDEIKRSERAGQDGGRCSQEESNI